MRRFLQRLRRNRRGNMALELALATPVMIGLLITTIEFSRYVVINQKVERTSATVADLVARAQFVSEPGIVNMMEASATVMEPFDVLANGQVIVSNISATGGNAPVINWQRTYGGGTGNSEFGLEGQNPTLPAGFTVPNGDSIVVCETFFDYEPLFTNKVLEATTLYRFTLFRPRFASLTTIVP
ncbi:MAG: pilus assembly protein [Rhodospirillales bacterium]|nr:pilus assembly protein [Rhodospirillales bacterium]